MRRIFPGLWLGFFSVTYVIAASDPAVTEIVNRIARVERRMPWLWSPSAEGLADIAYTYQTSMVRRISTVGGKEVGAPSGVDGLSRWRSLQFERIPLDWGSFMRC